MEKKFNLIELVHCCFSKKARDKRGMSIGDLYPIMLTFALVAVLIAIILYVLSSIGLNLPNGSAAQNATNTVITQIVNFIPWLGIILLVVAAAITIGVLINSFAGGRRV